MRILQLSSASSFGGGERYLVDLSNALNNRDHDVYVVLRPRSPIADQLRVLASRIRTLPLRNALDAPSARALARIVKEERIDVIHAHMARDYSLAAYAARSSKHAKLIVTRHVLFPLNALHRRTLGRASRIIAVSGAVARQLRGQRLVADNKIALVHNGIDVDRYAKACENFDRKEFLRNKELPVDCLLVSSIGELRKLKRHEDFIHAAAITAREVSNAHFVIAGVDTSSNEENRRELIALVEKLKLKDRFHFLGWLNDAEKLLCATDVFVSASASESFGLSIVEAMAAGTAVVATRTEGAQEVVEDQVNGMLVGIENVGELAESIVKLLKDEPLRRTLGTHARSAACERFSLNRMVDEIEKIYWVG